MKEVVFLSGKGGTGKTSLSASFATLAKAAVIADCDVDAPDMHLVTEPEIKERSDFKSGFEAVIDSSKCTGCGKCLNRCRFEAISFLKKTGKYRVEPNLCEGCGVCGYICPSGAIEFKEPLRGEWYISETRLGPMVHAKLGLSGENSGKLVGIVREEARKLGKQRGSELVIIDGPPGIGCPVIASVTGVDAAICITEPTLSGLHDLKRLLKLGKHFGVDFSVIVNKWDINPEITAEIEKYSIGAGADILGRVSWDRYITDAQIEGRTVVESGASVSVEEIKDIWEKLCLRIF